MIDIEKVLSSDAGSCMNCDEDSEEVYKFYLGNYWQCRLCEKCFIELTEGFKRLSKRKDK